MKRTENFVAHESITNLPGITVYADSFKNYNNFSIAESNDRLVKRFLKKVKKSDIVKEFIETLRFSKPSEINHQNVRRVRFIRKKIAQFEEKMQFSNKIY